MENFNLTGLTNTQLNELYFKIKKLMVVKRDEFNELNMRLGCLLATIDIEMNNTQCISCEEEDLLLTKYNIKPAPSTVEAPVVDETPAPAPSTVVDETPAPVLAPAPSPVAVEAPVVDETPAPVEAPVVTEAPVTEVAVEAPVVTEPVTEVAVEAPEPVAVEAPVTEPVTVVEEPVAVEAPVEAPVVE